MRQDAWACRDQCTPSMRATCARCAHDLSSLARGQSAVRAATPTTWALCLQCAHDLGFGCAHCAPNPVLIQCTVYSHCLDHCS